MKENVLNRLDDFEDLLSRGISEEEMNVFFTVTEKIKKNLEEVQ